MNEGMQVHTSHAAKFRPKPQQNAREVMILQSRGPPLERGKLFNGLASVGLNEIAMAPFNMLAKLSIVNYPKCFM